jgi:hypothetical protein
MKKEEVDLAIGNALQPHEPGSSRDSGYCEKGVSAVDLAHPLGNVSQPVISPSLPCAPSRRRHEEISIDSALANEAFRSFRIGEKEQFERVSAFECNQRKALSAHHACSLKRLAVQREASRDLKLEQVGRNRTCPPHVSLLTLCSTRLSSSTWRSCKSWQSTISERLMMWKHKTWRQR